MSLYLLQKAHPIILGRINVYKNQKRFGALDGLIKPFGILQPAKGNRERNPLFL
jgi:hypothetical protein